ncbi:hypothetical protein B0H10DRAFT_1963717 [Mycena sp. CBHHK59/15]|nr:hypothetical protein B0H10DRAFT_1963717 [Mycena sp. CBHHK59/15]
MKCNAILNLDDLQFPAVGMDADHIVEDVDSTFLEFCRPLKMLAHSRVTSGKGSIPLASLKLGGLTDESSTVHPNFELGTKASRKNEFVIIAGSSDTEETPIKAKLPPLLQGLGWKLTPKACVPKKVVLFTGSTLADANMPKPKTAKGVKTELSSESFILDTYSDVKRLTVLTGATWDSRAPNVFGDKGETPESAKAAVATIKGILNNGIHWFPIDRLSVIVESTDQQSGLLRLLILTSFLGKHHMQMAPECGRIVERALFLFATTGDQADKPPKFSSTSSGTAVAGYNVNIGPFTVTRWKSILAACGTHVIEVITPPSAKPPLRSMVFGTLSMKF